MLTTERKEMLVHIPEYDAGKQYPGPKSWEMLQEIRRYVLVEPYPFVMDLPKCEGMYIATVDGQRLLDFAGFFGAKLIGYNHPRMFEPDFLKRLQYAGITKTPNPDLLTPECLAFYRKLHEIAPRCMRNPQLEAYAINSGAEAVENMMKYLINLHAEKCQKRETDVRTARFIYFDSAFHGRTVFALNVTQLEHAPVVTRGFQGIIPGNLRMAFPAVDAERDDELNTRETQHALADLDSVMRRHGPEIVAVIIEPIQGAGGHRVAQPEFFRGLSELCHKHDVYLGLDEVQTAGGQTGDFFMADQLDLPHPPQVIATGKKLGCGVIYMLRPMHDRDVLDSTWGGSLCDMVRFVQEMKIVREEQLIEAVPEKAKHLCAVLDRVIANHKDLVGNRRGMGLYQGFTLREPSDRARLLAIARETQHLLLLGAGADTIRLRPCLHVSKDHIDLFGEKLDAALAQLGKEK